jgi:type IV pilus assembly protein PilC
MTLGTALNTLSRRKLKGGKEQIIAKLRDDIIKGDSLSEALAKHPQSFPALYISMIKAGEASGKLSDAMERLAKHYERMIEAREKVMMALIYPGIVMGVSSMTMIFTMTVVVPKFSKMFQELGSTMPAPTRFLMWLSSALIHWGWLMALLIIGGIMMLKRYIATPEGRLWWDKLMLRVPVVKNVISANCFAQFSSTLAALLQNGVPVLQALTIVENTLGNVVIAREVREARERVTDGSTISVPLAQGKIFPSMLTDMLAVGEETGDMAGSLVHIARRYSAELDRQVKVFTTVLEPLMIVLMAGMVGFIAVSMLMAVFDLTSGLNIK